ncbi:MAG: TraR/DksA C4-type zinc finger protein [Bacillota bacterium]
MALWEKEEAALREERRRLLEQLGEPLNRNRSVAFRDSVTELSFADNHPADLGSENFERSKDLSLREHHLSHLRLVEEALERIDAGRYGVCRRCRENIDPARLAAAPEAPLCLLCQEEEERGMLDPHRRPVEEERFLPPFAQKIVFGDPGFDQEDFWQEVARHNKRPRIFEDGLEDEETGLVEDVDRLTNEDFRDQLTD